MPIWRGKPLMYCDGPERVLGFLDEGHPVLKLAEEDPVFLGLDGDDPVYAQDISEWEPEEPVDTVGAFLDPSEQTHPLISSEYRFCELRAVMTLLSARNAEIAATAKAILGWHETHQFCAKCGGRSRIAQSGWQRNCPECGASHFPRTDPVVIMLITHGNSVLIGRSPGWPEGMYSLLAGFVEPGESIEAAVRREVLEESGITVGEVTYLSSQPWPFPSSLMFGCAGEATSTEITVDPEELDDAIWVNREEMVQALAGVHPTLKPARRGAIARFLLENWLADSLD